ncbi:HAD-IA family hydrolase [Streptomyces sp. NPDC055134]
MTSCPRAARHCTDLDDAFQRLDGLTARHEALTGEAPLPQAHRQLADTHGLTLDHPQFVAARLEPYSQPMPGMADLVRSLSESHRPALLSNVDHYYWQVVRTMHPELGVFSELPVSCDLGVAKPDAEASRRASEAAGVDPERSLFVDDTLSSIEAARAPGFQTY